MQEAALERKYITGLLCVPHVTRPILGCIQRTAQLLLHTHRSLGLGLSAPVWPCRLVVEMPPVVFCVLLSSGGARIAIHLLAVATPGSFGVAHCCCMWYHDATSGFVPGSGAVVKTTEIWKIPRGVSGHHFQLINNTVCLIFVLLLHQGLAVVGDRSYPR